MARKRAADVVAEDDQNDTDRPAMKTPGEDLATYERELRTLKEKKKAAVRIVNKRIKLIENAIAMLSDEILGEVGAHTGSLFDADDDES